MAFIETVPVGDASGEVLGMYQRAQKTRGYVPEYTKLFSQRPGVEAAWNALIRSVAGNLDQRRYELVTLAAARAMKSSYCMLAHASVLEGKYYSAQDLTRVMAGEPGPLDATDLAIMRYADKIARDASSVTQEDIDELRALGLSDQEVFDVAAAACARCFFSKLLDSLGAQPDAVYAAMEEDLRKQLVRGRAIAAGPVERVPEEMAVLDP